MAYPYPVQVQVNSFNDWASAPSAADWFAENGRAPIWVDGQWIFSNGFVWVRESYDSLADIDSTPGIKRVGSQLVVVGEDSKSWSSVNNTLRAKNAPMMIAGGDYLDVSQFTAVAGSPTMSVVTMPNGKKALKVVTGSGVITEFSVNALNDCLFGGDIYISVDASYTDGASSISYYVSPDSYTNFVTGSYNAPNGSQLNNVLFLCNKFTQIGTKQGHSVTGSITYPFKVASNKIRITPQSGKVATVYFYAVGIGSPNKSRVCVTIDDGYASWFQLGQPLAQARKIPTTMSVIPSIINGGYASDRAWLTQLKSFVNAGNSIVAHGPNTNYGAGNILSAYSGDISAAINDMKGVRSWIADNGLATPGYEKCYVWPQGYVQDTFADMTLMDAALAAGFNTGRAASGVATLRNHDAENSYQHLFAQIQGHTWSGSTAAEVTNISNITTAISNAATYGKDIFLMFHKVAPTATADGSMTALHIRVSDLTTIMDAIKTQIDAGTMEAVTLPYFALSDGINDWQSI